MARPNPGVGYQDFLWLRPRPRSESVVVLAIHSVSAFKRKPSEVGSGLACILDKVDLAYVSSVSDQAHEPDGPRIPGPDRVDPEDIRRIDPTNIVERAPSTLNLSPSPRGLPSSGRGRRQNLEAIKTKKKLVT
ncbi:hypothetical protein N7462_000018 [Penicillium macrosclerotiorum]|uniref:uncharacterized protein n=1 Tax=Penicillium macrosclerotiorum TaxID=303699 RepID=UPI0025469038|nr:uncharacterized protein N7462_000018 [Penicillium macrosclerotiorum]KAJ5698013.1 hypothetical protein N7462_000018 [Penicillium macrosclerotiorum]